MSEILSSAIVFIVGLFFIIVGLYVFFIASQVKFPLFPFPVVNPFVSKVLYSVDRLLSSKFAGIFLIGVGIYVILSLLGVV
jgi:sulfite exporter TauE/SafE